MPFSMDYRLLLLLHIPYGLSLTKNEGLQVLAQDPADRAGVLACVTSYRPRAYLDHAHDWAERGAEILKRSHALGVRWSYFGQADYPRGWYGLEDPPLVFSYRGEPVWRERPLLAVVGSRTPLTDSVVWMQRELARFLRLSGVGVVSGGARGVDQIAHQLALAARVPTVCVFPSGLIRPYPSGRESLWESICLADGALLSTYALDEDMRKFHFLQRNRWIAALADATLVVEANRRSGSHLTARLAREVDREVATLPVSVNATQGLGNLQLLSEGATLVVSAEDLLVFFERNRGKFSGPVKTIDDRCSGLKPLEGDAPKCP